MEDFLPLRVGAQSTKNVQEKFLKKNCQGVILYSLITVMTMKKFQLILEIGIYVILNMHIFDLPEMENIFLLLSFKIYFILSKKEILLQSIMGMNIYGLNLRVILAEETKLEDANNLFTSSKDPTRATYVAMC